MKRAGLKNRYSVEELVAAAYGEAGHVTRDRTLALILVSKMLEDWLKHSDRPDLVKQLETASS
jgi:hypothetical protein